MVIQNTKIKNMGQNEKLEGLLTLQKSLLKMIPSPQIIGNLKNILYNEKVEGLLVLQKEESQELQGKNDQVHLLAIKKNI